MAGLKTMINDLSEDTIDSFDSDLKDLVRKIKSGDLDSIEPEVLKDTIATARETSKFMLHKGRTSTHSAAASSYASDRAEDDARSKEEMDQLAERTIRELMVMTDDDWAQSGLKKPDWSKPLSYDTLVDIDKAMANRGIKTSDFEKYMSPAELKHGVEGYLEGEEEFKIDKSSKEDMKPAVDYFMDLAKARMRRTAHRGAVKAKKHAESQKLRPGDINRSMIDSIKKRDYQGAIRIFNDALKWDQNALGFEPIDLDAINTAISVYCELRDITAAERTMELIEKFHYAPTVKTYNTFMYTGAELRDDRMVLAWYNKLIEAGIRPDSHTFSALIATYGLMGNEALALKWFDEMRTTPLSSPIDTNPYAHIIHMYGMVLNNVPEALKWARRMMTDNVSRDDDSYLNEVIAALQISFKKDRAAAIAKRDAEPKSIQQQFIEAFVAGNGKEVEKIWESMRYNSAHLTEQLWSVRILHASNVAKLDDAAKLWQELLDEGFSPSRATCASMVQVFRRLGDLDRSQEVLELSKTAPAGEPLPSLSQTSGVSSHNPYRPAAPAFNRLR